MGVRRIETHFGWVGDEDEVGQNVMACAYGIVIPIRALVILFSLLLSKALELYRLFIYFILLVLG
jgi:hypothetical protein